MTYKGIKLTMPILLYSQPKNAYQITNSSTIEFFNDFLFEEKKNRKRKPNSSKAK